MEEDTSPVEEATAEEQTTEPQVVTSVPEQPKASKKPSKKTVLIILLVVVLLGLGAAAYFMFVKKDNKTDASKTNTNQTQQAGTAAPVTEAQKQIDRFTTPTTGETWITPKELPLQGFLTTSSNSESSDTLTYYEVGKRAGNTIIMLIEDQAGQFIELYEKAADGKVSVIVRPNANVAVDAESEKSLETRYRSDIVVNKDLHYDSLSIPAGLTIGNNETVSGASYQGIGNKREPETGVVETVVKKFGASTLVKRERPYTDTKLTAISYYAKLPSGTEVGLPYAPIAEKFDGFKWNNGTDVTGNFGGIVRGCGAGVSVSRADGVDDSTFAKTGTTATGQVVYEFKDQNNVLVQKAWQETRDFYNGTTGTDAPKATVSLADFLKQHAIFAYKSPNQGWLVYTSDAYAPIGGCAKPVVYLYPTVPTQVSVKVGADVKISDPLYDPATGWHAFAWPNGQLLVNGKSYGSLFWEGPGHGEYPGISTGTVVKHADVVSTMRSQLALQGFNAQEISDFVEYWQGRVPNKPYVRLSWLTTGQMNNLAPLSITPKPTTLIRTFLDMAGSDSYYAMPAPQFSAPARTGFTATEWGGLSHAKLY